jgi:DNA-binding transcriptional ArsR family regulator
MPTSEVGALSTVSEEVVDKDILFVMLNNNRDKILHFLQERNDYSSSRQISEATGISMSNVSFHCGKLADRRMIHKEIESGKAVVMISSKGIKVIQEVDERRQRKGIARKRKKDAKVGSDKVA